MRNRYKIILFLLLSAFATAQNANRKFISHKEHGNQIDIAVSDGNYQLKFYNTGIVETSFIPKGETFNPESHAVVMKPSDIKIKKKENSASLDFETSGLTVKIQKAPFKISYFYNGKELLSEKNGYTKTDKAETLDFNLDNSELLYGGGARALGMNRRGNRLQLYNRAHYGYETHAELMNFTIPMVLSSKIYAVHFDNAPIGWLDLDSKKDNTLTYETISGRKTYQVIAGESWAKLLENYTALTGRQPLPPRWAFGNFSSRFGYHSEEEVTKTIDKFRKDSIPVDAIILDLYWFGKTIQGTMGNLEFDKDNFPNPEKMISDLNNKGVKTILITEPFILTTSKKWQEAVDKKILATDKSGNPFKYDFYFGNTGLIDIFRPEGKKWFWDIYKNLVNLGVGGWWGDLGEPEVHPSELQHATGSADQVHNIYGHNWAKLVSEGYKKDFPEQRPFILMRSGYSGSQRFGMIPWSGDVSRSWGGLQSQPEIALQMGMQGMAYMHSDLGGFAGDYFDNELYIRWLQYGVFQPVFRPHAQEEVASEPVYKDIVTKAKAKKQVELRYSMLPYNYNIAFENNHKGIPMMRPLFFEEPANQELLSMSETYLWGNDFLVTPITKPGAQSTSVYFPKTSNWYDFQSGQKHAGGNTETIPVQEDHIPVFVRGGAFIPMSDVVQSTEKYSQDHWNVHFWFDPSVKNSARECYLDDGKTPDAFEKGNYEMLDFNSKLENNSLTIDIADKAGKNQKKSKKTYQLILHGLETAPKEVIFDNKKMAFSYNSDNRTYTIAIELNPDDTQIKIRL